MKLPEASKLLPYILAIYGVGVVGLSIPFLEPVFIRLVPLNITLALVLALIYHTRFELKFIVYAFFIGVSGFFIEWAGVHTGKIFGIYWYGETLGPGWDEIPFLIGINWFFLVYAVLNLLYSVKINWFVKALIGAFLMTFYDLVLEPTAIRLDFWTWKDDIIPIQNYIAWFCVSFVFLSIGFLFKFVKTQNKMAVYLFYVQLAFFTLLVFVNKLITGFS